MDAASRRRMQDRAALAVARVRHADQVATVAAAARVATPAPRRPPKGRKPPPGRRTPALGHLVPPGAMLAGPELPPPWEPRRPNGAIPRPGKPTKEEAACCQAWGPSSRRQGADRLVRAPTCERRP